MNDGRRCRKVNRRVAVVTLGSVIATSGLAWLGLRGAEEKAQPQVSGYQQPDYWDDASSEQQSLFLGWDQLVWQVEGAAGPPPPAPDPLAPFNSAAGLMKAIMEQPGITTLKCNLASFVADSRREHYVAYLLAGLNPATSEPKVRSAVVWALRSTVDRMGMQMFTPTVRATLVAAFQAEPDSYTRQQLDKLLDEIQEPH